jgi:hypothetical protein
MGVMIYLLTLIALNTTIMSETMSTTTEQQHGLGTIYFSNKPMNDKYDGAKKQFTSAESIYAKLVLNNGKTVKEAFKLADKVDGRPLVAIPFRVYLYFNGNKIAENNRGRYLLLRGDSKTATSLSFDIKPHPSTITSVFTEDYYPDGMVAAFLPFYDLYMSGNGKNFRQSGTYRVQVVLYNIPVDAFGNEDPKQRKEISVDFDYTHNPEDLEAIVQANDDAAGAMKTMAYTTNTLPAVFAHPAQSGQLSYDKITTILKRDMPWATLVKVAIGPGTGDEWEVEKDKFGLPRQKWFNRKIHIIYKHKDKCHIGTADLIQEYEGNGKYGELKLGYRSENDLLIDCALVK